MRNLHSDALVCVLFALCTLGVQAVEHNVRVKSVVTWQNADAQDAVSVFGVDPAYGVNLDARVTTTGTLGGKTSPWRWELAGELTTLQGDTLENASFFNGQSSGEALDLLNDQRRAVNLTHRLSRGSRHAATLRLDRAQLVWQREQWRVRVGRQALSLGSGLVFNPMDVFSPFAPTATDRDFKNGEDALVVTRLGRNGSELEGIAVARRLPGDDHVRGNQGSYGVRYRSVAGAYEYELLAARHFSADLAMLSLSGPLGGAVWRLNWVGSRESSRTTHSLVANIDLAFGFRDQAGYAFAEYYHNGYGSNSGAENLAQLDQQALDRLSRGEVFVLERNYLAAGTSLGLSPLLTATATAIVNLDDGAPLLQSAFSYTAGNNTTVELGAIIPTGGPGEEFGGIVLGGPLSGAGPTGTPLLTGSTRQYYLRLVSFL